MILLQFDVRGNVADRVKELAGESLQSATREMVREAAILSLEKIISGNPVDTGRSRAAWVQSLEQLGGTTPAGWEGPHPTGVAEGRALGELVEQSHASGIQISISNAVDYLPELEYGTSRVAPFAMVRGGLMAVRSQLIGLFRLL